jgi:hypothetical protein
VSVGVVIIIIVTVVGAIIIIIIIITLGVVINHQLQHWSSKPAHLEANHTQDLYTARCSFLG